MDSKTKSLIIMYHEIHRLRNTEGFSIQRIADYLSLNFRTVKKYLDLIVIFWHICKDLAKY